MVSAAYPRWPWSDLVSSLTPNGRFLDSRVSPKGESRNPIGVPKETYIDGLFALGAETGTYCGEPPYVPCIDDTANLPAWYTRIQAGEPPTQDARTIANQIYDFHQGYGTRRRAQGWRRCCSRVDGRTTCSRRRSRSGSIGRCGPPIPTRTWRCSSATSDTPAGRTRSMSIASSTIEAAGFFRRELRGSGDASAARAPAPGPSPRSRRPVHRTPRPTAPSGHAATEAWRMAACGSPVAAPTP